MVNPSNSPTLNELRDLLPFLTQPERAELDLLLSKHQWLPLPGPQTLAANSKADVLYYGGAAGGGKTDLLIGLALTQHQRSIIFRREATQLQGIYDRVAEILGTRQGFNGHDKIWRLAGMRQLEFGACKDPGSEVAYQGRPHDFKGFDEITHFLESQFRFLMGWKRTTRQSQRTRVVCAGNPPTDSDGEWVVRYWAPWLDDAHPNPAEDGELRWFVVMDGKDVEVDGPEPIIRNNEALIPHSRTFIRSMVQDNPFLMETGYEQTLQALPEPLRSQMLYGDFRAGRDDDPWQVIPTAWVKEAQERWEPRDRKGRMTTIACDVARGGRDWTIISRRHGEWFDELLAFPGSATPDGPTVAGLVVSNSRNNASQIVDVIGVGASVYDFLNESGANVTGWNNAESSSMTDRSGRLAMKNKRAEAYWHMRELLDPANGEGIALPPDDQLRADLCAARWKMTAQGVQIESKEDIYKRIERSTDRGDAVVMAALDVGLPTNGSIPTRPKGWIV